MRSPYSSLTEGSKKGVPIQSNGGELVLLVGSGHMIAIYNMIPGHLLVLRSSSIFSTRRLRQTDRYFIVGDTVLTAKIAEWWARSGLQLKGNTKVGIHESVLHLVLVYTPGKANPLIYGAPGKYKPLTKISIVISEWRENLVIMEQILQFYFMNGFFCSLFCNRTRFSTGYELRNLLHQ